MRDRRNSTSLGGAGGRESKEWIAATRPAPAAEALDGDQQRLFEALRTLRQKLAREQSVPPYVIFHNTALLDMAKKKPADAAAMSTIPGVGQIKLERYGAAFLEEIEAFQRKSNTE